ncbi:D-isomer specific 2-hydroxyacid dehydrogenase, catalytic domain [Duganella sp. CF402]|uniref:2-hydroxyacid dehydrogenase n=1 Tax=unclassified Duganella TaxID=2636909 RepID=UPI0008C405FB|nr:MULTISPECIES: 2-hydroxyacid dehydrogenase [unclassified Duganella]RZT10362.1 lactate dehydrogenase-like 2-hydroxyacid dehydrogenase [Duganella sp. BK701]SEL16447.1 D-isomer specific 2-hydroxyacid dehydrogenase, catalytic domain [Duganella sp. CF402]
MKPEVLVYAASQSASVMAQLEQYFDCRHLWQQPAGERAAWLEGVTGKVRAVLTTGGIGITAAQLAQLPKVEIVAVNGIGTDAVDLDACRARGVAVTNTPGVLTDDVADLALTLLLSAARRLPALDFYVRTGAWEAGKALAPTRALRGKVCGIYGFGAIGQAIALRAQAFGMQVQYYQPRVKEGVSVPRTPSLLALAEASDYLVVAAPGSPATRHTVDAAVLAALGPQGTLVNIARGSLVDEEALITALRDRTLGMAALDVFTDEPRVPAALRELEHVVLTPHVGSLTVETRHAMGQLVVDNLRAHFAGKPLLTPVA